MFRARWLQGVTKAPAFFMGIDGHSLQVEAVDVFLFS
jgi:hypothetical protein